MSEGELKKRIRSRANPFYEYQKHMEELINKGLKPELDRYRAKLVLNSNVEDMLLPVSSYEEVLDEAKQDFAVYGVWVRTINKQNFKTAYDQREAYLDYITDQIIKWFGEAENSEKKI